MADGDDLLLFAEEDDPEEQEPLGEPWHILVVDDEPEVHTVTRIALKNFTFANRPLELHTANSAAEARELLSTGDTEFSIAIIDVVMESDLAGLDLVKWIREEQNNPIIRLVLRTGEPGQAPEREVISNYDINDYKEKTELTANKLFTLMHSCLRSYRDINALTKNKEGLEVIIRSSRRLFAHQSLNEFTQGALAQLSALLHVDQGAFYSEINSLAAFHEDDTSNILAATGRFSGFVGCKLEAALSNSNIDRELFDRVLKEGGQIFGEHYYIGVYDSHAQRKNLLFLEGVDKINELDKNLVQFFGANVGVAFDNQDQFAEEESSLHEIICGLAEIIEGSPQQNSQHVKRVANICRLLAEKSGQSEHNIQLIFKASPLHDVGKIAIPKSILNTPAKLDEDEWELMRTHAQKGHDMFASSEIEVLRTGAIIAISHHENWDGSGYPKGLVGDAIPMMGRITAVADVWDNLLNRRYYKDPWLLEDAVKYFSAMKSKQFDPVLVDIVLANQEELALIRSMFPDS